MPDVALASAVGSACGGVFFPLRPAIPQFVWDEQEGHSAGQAERVDYAISLHTMLLGQFTAFSGRTGSYVANCPFRLTARGTILVS